MTLKGGGNDPDDVDEGRVPPPTHPPSKIRYAENYRFGPFPALDSGYVESIPVCGAGLEGPASLQLRSSSVSLEPGPATELCSASPQDITACLWVPRYCCLPRASVVVVLREYRFLSESVPRNCDDRNSDGPQPFLLKLPIPAHHLLQNGVC